MTRLLCLTMIPKILIGTLAYMHRQTWRRKWIRRLNRSSKICKSVLRVRINMVVSMMRSLLALISHKTRKVWLILIRIINITPKNKRELVTWMIKTIVTVMNMMMKMLIVEMKILLKWKMRLKSSLVQVKVIQRIIHQLKKQKLWAKFLRCLMIVIFRQNLEETVWKEQVKKASLWWC